MRGAGEPTETAARFVNRLVELYPAGAGYSADRDRPVIEAVADLVDEGRVERTPIDGGVDPETGAPTGAMVCYRLTDEYAEEIRRVAAERSESAGWN